MKKLFCWFAIQESFFNLFRISIPRRQTVQDFYSHFDFLSIEFISVVLRRQSSMNVLTMQINKNLFIIKIYYYSRNKC